MKQQEVFKKIGGIIREINEQYEYLETAGDVYNDLELELLSANAHFLSDHIEILKKISKHVTTMPAPAPPKSETAENKPAAEPRFFEPVMGSAEHPVVVEPEATEEPAPTVEFEIGQQASDESPAPEEVAAPAAEELPPAVAAPAAETIRHELTLEDIGEDWDEEDDEAENIELEPQIAVEEKPAEIKAEEPVKIPEPLKPEVATTPEPVEEKNVREAEPVKPAVHTRILVEEEQVLTLNQRMSAQLGTSRVSDQLSGQPISDLKSAITLNDKMLYVKELFNGYSLAYSEALDILNRLKTFEEAQSFLKGSYATKNNWTDKAATADRFYALLQRRYM